MQYAYARATHCPPTPPFLTTSFRIAFVADSLTIYQAPTTVVIAASPLVGDLGSFGQRLGALPLAQLVRQVVPVKLLTLPQVALLLALGRQRVLAQPMA